MDYGSWEAERSTVHGYRDGPYGGGRQDMLLAMEAVEENNVMNKA